MGIQYREKVVTALLGIWMLLSGMAVSAQTATASLARQYVAEKNYDKAIATYTEVYGLAPDSVYKEYLNTLITAKKYKQAEKLVEKQMTLRDNPFLHVDLGVAYAADDNVAKAKEQFEMMFKMVNGDDMLTQRIAKSFIDDGRDDYAILTYEKAIQILGTPYVYLYSGPLCALYVKTGNLEKAIDVIVGASGQQLNSETVKTMLLEVLGTDQNKLRQTQKILVKKINEQPDNVFLADVLTWIYTQKNDWDGALIQIEAIDERNRENGKRLIEFARVAVVARQYEAANKAYEDILSKGVEGPYFVMAKSEMLSTAFTRVRSDVAWRKGEVDSLAALYDSFLVAYPKYYSMQTASDFATLLAQYAGNVPRAISVLKKAIAEPDTRRMLGGAMKLQLGDYYALIGKLWDASLTYSQVDKDFKQDAQGEDARFRNAKLAYYRGDFDWAQRQLSILKTATTQLIANDALYLSVLITENVEDSVTVPLQRFAYAGLLLFQNREKEATELLDSIAHAFPKHPLNDDILMMRVDIAMKGRAYDRALTYLAEIQEKYGKDVLGDDAVFRTAAIYGEYLHEPEKAKKYYEQVIIDYPGSTYVQLARQKLVELNNGVNP